MSNLSSYLLKLSKLKVDRSKGAPAPHKAILLISVIQLIDNGFIIDNNIGITPELVARFKDNWRLLVIDDRFNPNFSLPFYHLKSDKFWKLKTILGKEILLTSSFSIRSFTTLKDAVDFAYFEDDFYSLLMDGKNRVACIENLLSVYLLRRQLPYLVDDTFSKVESQILHESSADYTTNVKMLDAEDVFVRGGVFKKVIPRQYDYTCCISRMKIVATRDIQMIDACHIIPFSESYDDTIKNGISLSPNLHRAFDRFIITINQDFEVIVSNDFKESGYHSIRDFHGKKIFLPKEQKYYPSLENLKWHNDRFMKLQSNC